ncbi:hypothetical protein [Gottfriedia solisilvae]|uniref:hypothetical protein n=1 Tax=Gottfriedia solisilvae TaxID=1516104 RepID=UPI003D2F5134
METENIRPLEEKEYQRLLMTVLNDNTDLAYKLAAFRDSIYLYLHEPTDQQLFEVELNMISQELKYSFSDENVINKYLSGEYKLIHAELKIDQMYSNIHNGNNVLISKGISYDPDLYKDLVNIYNDKLTNDRSETIKNIHDELINIENKLNNIEDLIESMTVYGTKYIQNDNHLIDSINSYGYEINHKVNNLLDSWIETKELYEKVHEFLQISLKMEVEKHLKELNIDNLPNVNLKFFNTEVAELIANNHDLTVQTLLPVLVNANENNGMERIGLHVENHIIAEQIEYSLKRMELYDPSINFDGSKLHKHIGQIKEHNIGNAIEGINKSMSELYGPKFKLFEQNELLEPSDALLKKITPIYLQKSYRPSTLQQLEVESKSDKLVKSFWQDKSNEMFTSYIEEGGKSKLFENVIHSPKEIESLQNNINRLLDDPTDFTDISLRKLDRQIDESINVLSGIQLDLRNEYAHFPSDRKELLANPSLNAARNTVINNIEHVFHAIDKLETTKEYVNIKQNIKELENKMELEL